jgi:putative transposase
MEHDIQILSGKISHDHIHVFIFYHPYQDISKIVKWLGGPSSRVLLQEFPHLRKHLWGRHIWAREYLAVSWGTLVDQMIEQCIAEQEGELIHDGSQFVIDENTKPSRSVVVPLSV